MHDFINSKLCVLLKKLLLVKKDYVIKELNVLVQYEVIQISLIEQH